MSRRWSKDSQNVALDKDRAFRLLFRQKTIASVWYWLERLGVPVRDRRDVLQDVFCSALQSFPTYDPMRSRPERWLNDAGGSGADAGGSGAGRCDCDRRIAGSRCPTGGGAQRGTAPGRARGLRPPRGGEPASVLAADDP